MIRKNKDYKTIGIIGGMGPLATCDFFEKIIRMTDASCDSEHIPILIDCNPRIPDRVKAILHGGEDPVPEILRSAKRLVREGASILLMGCNTAYYFYDRVAGSLPVPLINMPAETAKGALRFGYKKVGLMATDGTVQSGVYSKELEKLGIEPVLPSAEGQRAVMEMIYDGIKAGNSEIDPSAFIKAANGMMEAGADAIILGCTELPIAYHIYNIDLPYLDPAVFAAEAAVTAAGGKVRTLRENSYGSHVGGII
ncbi:MAG: amino acid racemase [Clostridia bacterium]|nr:amino acid racemase [Clostridia bacterium]